jgi:hypothetical protein
MSLHPEDESKTGTLPDPELNPLLNPLLAANMGRWAEVYFTNPPEKRAEAVAQLLHELEKNPQSEQDFDSAQESCAQPTKAKGEDVLLRRSFQSAEPADATVTCTSCGHPNGGTQRFCGMCGMPLSANEVESVSPSEPEVIRQRSWHDQASSENEVAGTQGSHFNERSPASYPGIDLPSFASVSDDSDGREADGLFQYESRPARRNFRVYVGIGLAIVLSLLVYKTWRRNASLWANHTAPAAVPQEPLSPSPASSAPSAATPPASPSAPQEKTAENTGNAVTNKSEPSSTTNAAETSSKPTARKGEINRTAPSANNANASDQSGASELALGQRYLNGGPGTARDSGEAASWLWKAVAKKNLSATLLLSDLYLRGDGVPKSCDQARLLLDAAARKGNAAAAERLRNLPAFGCQ